MRKIITGFIVLIITMILISSLYNLLEKNLVNYSKRPVKMALTFYSYSSNYNKELKEEMINAVTDNEDIMIATSANDNEKSLLTELINFKDEGYQYIFVTGANTLKNFNVTPFKSNGIKLIGVNDYCSFCNVSVYVDNFNAGQLEALEVTRNLEGAKIVLISDNSYESVERVKGIEKLLISYPEFEIVSKLDDASELKYLFEYDAILATTDNLAISALDYANPKSKIYSIGGSPEIKQLISNGYIQAAIGLRPISVASNATDFAYKIQNGEKVSDLKIGFDVFSQDNINNEDLTGWK